MKIIETARAPNPRRVRILLAEKGLTVPFEQIDIMASDHKRDPFDRMNPFQQVPILILDDGTAISESMAICRYFEEMQPEPALFGRTARARAEVEMWQRRVEFQIFVPIAQCFRHLHPAMAPLEVPQVPAWGEANRPRALKGLKVLDQQLAASQFVAGDEFSVADITALVAVDFMKPARIERPSDLANLERWYRQVSARPSAKA